MRILKNNSLRTMTSPIKYVMSHVHDALVNIAPEKKEKFDELYKDFILEYIDSQKYIIEVEVQNKKINLSRGAVEIFWATSYGYLMFYEVLFKDHQIKGGTKIVFDDYPELSKPISLLKWIYERWTNNIDTQWPSDLPKPKENPTTDTMEYVAQELCLAATAFALHHELAHLRLDHSMLQNIDEEKEADLSAVDWLSDKLFQDSDPCKIKRALAISLVFETLTAKSIYTNHYSSASHPDSHIRLFESLDAYIDDPNHFVWQLVCATLSLHFANNKIPIPPKEFDSFHECVMEYILILREKANSSRTN